MVKFDIQTNTDLLCRSSCNLSADKKFLEVKRNIKQYFLLAAFTSQYADFARLAPKIAPKIFNDIDFDHEKMLRRKQHVELARENSGLEDFLQKEINGKLTQFNIRNKI